jgi:hypothetical protein
MQETISVQYRGPFHFPGVWNSMTDNRVLRGLREDNAFKNNLEMLEWE